jgi:hypothetical protein
MMERNSGIHNLDGTSRSMYGHFYTCYTSSSPGWQLVVKASPEIFGGAENGCFDDEPGSKTLAIT